MREHRHYGVPPKAHRGLKQTDELGTHLTSESGKRIEKSRVGKPKSDRAVQGQKRLFRDGTAKFFRKLRLEILQKKLASFFVDPRFSFIRPIIARAGIICREP